jgi:hypothetical protein
MDPDPEHDCFDLLDVVEDGFIDKDNKEDCVASKSDTSEHLGQAQT